MRNMILAGAAAIAICGAATILAAQAVAQEQPPVVQTQANPPGSGIPSVALPNPPTAGTPVPPSMPADSSYHAGPYKGALTPAPEQAMNRAYPLCTRNLQDSCVNPGESEIRSAFATPKHRASPRRLIHTNHN